MIKKFFDNKYLSFFITILCIISMVAMALATIIASGYTVNQSDDYTYAHMPNISERGLFGYIGDSASFAGMIWMTRQGTYSAMFFKYLLTSLSNGGLTELRVVMMLNALLFIIAIVMLVLNVFRKLVSDSNSLAMLFATGLLFCILNYRLYTEIFYWFSGAMCYSWPLLFGLAAMIIDTYLAFRDFNNKKNCVIAVIGFICAVVACGGSMTVVMFCCYFVMLGVLYRLLHSRKLQIKDIIIFIGFILGAIINVIGPGNFVRLGSNKESLSLIEIIKYTIAFGTDNYSWLFHETNFVVIFLLLFVIGMLVFGRENKNLNMPIYSIVSVLGLLSPWAVIFPVVFGYGKGFIANRCQFMIDIALYIAVCNSALVIGWWTTKFLGTQYRKLLGVIVGIIAFSSLCLSSYSVKQMGTYITYANIRNGSYKNYYYTCKDFYNYLSNHEGEDIVVNIGDVPAPISDFSCMYLENGWVNESIGRFYKLNSLVVEE